MRLPEKANVLLLGSGGREHALAAAIARSRKLGRLFIAPGNAGTASCGTNVELSPVNFGPIKQFVLSNNINLVVVGPEEPLVRGIYDFFNEDSQIHHIPVVGPSAVGAKLEGSKDFAKAFMARHGVPTARYMSFNQGALPQAHAFLESLEAPYVLKADGLAAGKGVVILDDLAAAKCELAEMLGGKFGMAGETVVIEEYMRGIECSVFVATDGNSYKILPSAKDYKRIGDGDTGPNTGGMGAISPPPFADEVFMQRVTERIIEPTVRGLKAEKIVYKGFIFIGLMNDGGEPRVVEYNVRLGDPETEAIMPRIESDVLDLLGAIAFGTLSGYDLRISPMCAATVVAASEGYPGEYGKGFEITGLDKIADSSAFHSGTQSKAGKVLTSGGRVLAVTSLGATLGEALEKSYTALSIIDFKGIHYRRDIGQDVL